MEMGHVKGEREGRGSPVKCVKKCQKLCICLPCGSEVKVKKLNLGFFSLTAVVERIL